MTAAHDHRHDHRHTHGHSSEKRVLLTFALITIFMAVEAVGGWLSGSLTLMADAGHMLTDSAALALALMAQRATRQPIDALMSYGRDRFSVLAALINGLGLIAIVIWIAVEAIRRLVTPEPVLAVPMLAIAIAGLAVNSGAFFLLHGADRDNLNIHAALLHVLGDILASLAAVVAALVILLTGWTPADPILSTIAGALILRNAVSLVRRSWHVLMESTPEGVNAEEIEESLEALDGVADIHHLHAWSLVPGKPLITLHARVETGHEPDDVLARIKQELVARYGIDHSTIQMERSCPDPVEHHDDGHGHDGDHSDHDHGQHDHGHRMAAS
ncbi:MAG TPA: cation diffusion facilitator family transporter [Alphaproteobacteria bacterium]|nr:cation diffusion facilitator family transporter [Alphaproteobacteria bacterium]